MSGLSWTRLRAIVHKEFVQMRRDRLTFAMMIGVPVIQLVIFGLAINTDPKQLPTAVVAAEASPFARSLTAALTNTGYFRIVAPPRDLAEAERWLARGEVQFVLHVPSDFSRRLLRGERPAVLLEADATDPVATGNALAALAPLTRTALRHDLKGMTGAEPPPEPFELRLHRRYNPEGITQYNIIPGLLGVVLTMTMIMMTALGITRELERGTMENLLAMPVQPLEVMLGKIAPYIVVGYVQVGVILIAAFTLFEVPMAGSLWLLLGCTFVFIVANLTLGITFSSSARNQTQAIQMSFFFLLPSILLSGFMFPYRGMPEWAQWLGEGLPMTHFMRLTRGIILKDHGVADVWGALWPLLIFTAVVAAVGLRRYRRTLD